MKNYQQKVNISEGLRRGDLENYISNLFTIDQYKSKMGEDKDIVVVAFKVKEKYPAMDLVEFIEKSYNFILDADMSAGEEYDGKYHVFVEIERTPNLVEQLTSMIGDLEHLTKNNTWNFIYQKDKNILEFNETTIKSSIPLTKEDYDKKVLEFKNTDIKNFFNQGSVDVSVDENNNLTFKRPFANDITAKFISIGDYESIKDTLPGAIDLSENSQSQIIFLNKFLGNYSIDKINNKFLIRNKDQAIIIEKDRW